MSPVRVELDGLGLVDESRPAHLDRLVQEQVRLPHPAEGRESRGQGARKGQKGAIEQEEGLEDLLVDALLVRDQEVGAVVTSSVLGQWVVRHHSGGVQTQPALGPVQPEQEQE